MQVFNCDQSGINLEMVGKGTLAPKGVKTVELVAQRIGATTHSISVQPLISADGTLNPKLLVCFYEPKGAPQLFLAELAKFTNLDCCWSTSGKFGSAHQEKWLRTQFLPLLHTDTKALLILDEWSGYKGPIKCREVTEMENLEIRTIPAGATGKIQPLDVEFNRQFKVFLRLLCSKIRHYHPSFIISVRKNLATLLSLIHRQFCAPRFRDFIQYSWFKSGYYDKHPPPFMTPPQYCLQKYPANSRCDCKELCFTRCAYCEKFFCFKHFVEDYHNCEQLYPVLH